MVTRNFADFRVAGDEGCIKLRAGELPQPFYNSVVLFWA